MVGVISIEFRGSANVDVQISCVPKCLCKLLSLPSFLFFLNFFCPVFSCWFVLFNICCLLSQWISATGRVIPVSLYIIFSAVMGEAGMNHYTNTVKRKKSTKVRKNLTPQPTKQTTLLLCEKISEICWVSVSCFDSFNLMSSYSDLLNSTW